MGGNGEFEVGFGRPPKESRFRKGQSGNPAGRPKGTKNLATILARELRERVVINENGRRKTITKLEAAIKQVVNKAAGGDLAALKQLHALVRSAEENSAAQPHADNLSVSDEKVMQGILQRFELAMKEGSDVPEQE